MDVLIPKLGAACDIVRTTTLLRSLTGRDHVIDRPTRRIQSSCETFAASHGRKEIPAGPPSWNIWRTTYSPAVALRDWFREHNMPEHCYRERARSKDRARRVESWIVSNRTNSRLGLPRLPTYQNRTEAFAAPCTSSS